MYAIAPLCPHSRYYFGNGFGNIAGISAKETHELPAQK
jgi:hypothetical protein